MFLRCGTFKFSSQLLPLREAILQNVTHPILGGWYFNHMHRQVFV